MEEEKKGATECRLENGKPSTASFYFDIDHM
jgi:hypothetical protein